MSNNREYGGRLPLNEKEKKSEVIKVRLTINDRSKLKELYDKSYSKNLSILIRDVLFKQAIRVDVSNPDVANIVSLLKSLQSSCSLLTRSQRREAIDFHSELVLINENIQALKDSLINIQKTDLYLEDLRNISEEQKKTMQIYPSRRN